MRWFCCFAVLRLLELKNTKTAERVFLAEMPSLGFRGLEFEFSDSWCHKHHNCLGEARVPCG
ncbi:hypothetical protein B1A62_03550 [Corynebacterium diphtheriae]|nr:hypothetical protein B1A62_03550 [Corynebacterium diphtheriae]